MKIRVMMVREGRKRDVAGDSPAAVYRFMRKFSRNLDREHVWRIDLSARNRIIGYEVVSVGTLTASLIHPREVYTGALMQKSAAIIVVHNHPSQETTPSPEDEEITRRLLKAGEILGIPLIDHLIVAEGNFFSFREAGLI